MCITGNDVIKKREGRKINKDIREWNKRIIMEILFFFFRMVEGGGRVLWTHVIRLGHEVVLVT